jgi:hypothetical protein
MATTVAGTFADRTVARRGVERLRDGGIPASAISLIVRDADAGRTPVPDSGIRGGAVATRAGMGAPVVREEVASEEIEPVVEDYPATAAGTASGALLGGITGFLLGLGTLAIPGLGPVLAAGPIAAALGGAAIGAAGGGLIGALIDAGVPEEYASAYATDVERGHVLVTVTTDTASRSDIRDILGDAGALNVYPKTVAV